MYLRPGLTGGQRRAALRRLRQEASRGCGPALPGPDLTVALAADRFRVGLRNAAAVIRVHPAGSLLPTALAGLLLTLFVLASVSAPMVQLPQPPSGGPITAVGSPAGVGAPVLVQKGLAAGPVSQPRGTSGGGGQAQPPWSLAASSSQAKSSRWGRSSAQACLQSRDRAAAQGWQASAGCRPDRAAAKPSAWAAQPQWQMSMATASADWGDIMSVNADWGDGPSAV